MNMQSLVLDNAEKPLCDEDNIGIYFDHIDDGVRIVPAQEHWQTAAAEAEN